MNRAGTADFEDYMNTLATLPKPGSIKLLEHGQSYQQWDVLIVSSRTENGKSLIRILGDLPINVFAASTIGQARELLGKHPVEMIFCEEFLPDGTYRELLEFVIAERSSTAFVVTLCTGEWDEYLEATHLGATDVLRCPLQAIDVELVLIRAGRNRNRFSADLLA
jgi:DNA-binding NtrC family response regulator